MKIWFDGQCLQTSSRLRGIGRYASELIRALSQRPGVELSISFNAAMPNEALAAREVVSAWIAPRDIHIWESAHVQGEAYTGMTPARARGQAAIAYHVAALAPDVAISTSPFEGHGDAAMPIEPNPSLGTPLASIFYDAIPHRYPDRYLTAPGLRASYERRLALLGGYDLNLCISAYSTREAAEIGGVDNVDIGAGVSPDFLNLLEEARSPVPAGPYVLYVGGLDWRKNVGAVADAMARLPGHLRDVTRFVVAGDHAPDLLKELRGRWRARGLRDDMLVVQPHVSDLELTSLYRGAAVAVQPSYLEGFGLTALEAMTCGAPVLAAARGAAPEVVQNPDYMFDPDDHARLAALIARMIDDRDFRAAAIAAGGARAKAFSWEKTAAIAHEALARLAAARPRAAAQDLRAVRRAAVAELRRRAPEAADDVDALAQTMARAEPARLGPGRLFVDCTSLLRHDAGTGIQRVTRQISRRLAARDGAICLFGDDVTAFRAVAADGERPIPPDPRVAAPPVAPRCEDVFLMLDSSWEFHEAHARQLLPARLRGAEVVSTLYDLVPLMQPAFCVDFMPGVFRAWLCAALGFSTGFVCISRAVAEQLRGLLEAIDFPHPMKIDWWPLGADFKAAVAPSSPRPPGARPSFLMVGTIEPRKGYDVALAAFERLWAQGLDAELTIIGKAGWDTEALIARMKACREAGRPLLLRLSVSDEELGRAYAYADALISASYGEGFGLPLVEARHFGKPAIVSDLPVFREVTEGARDVMFFAPGDADALAAAVRRFIAGERASDRVDATAFDWPGWDDSARRLADVLRAKTWRMSFEPRRRRAYASRLDIGETRMRRLLGPHERDHRIELLSCERRENGALLARVRVTNLSGALWSSNLDDGGRFGFALTAQGHAASGAAVGARARATLPFVLPHGWDAILPIELPAVPSLASIAFEAEQDGGARWGGALRTAAE